MALTGTDYGKKCPLFDRTHRSTGVLFPYHPGALNYVADTGTMYANLDGSAKDIFARFRLPMSCVLVTCEAFACSDDQNVKSAAASTEPVLGINYGTADLVSATAGTEIATITCNGAGAKGKKWSGSTTETIIKPADEVVVYLKTAAASATSTKQDGGAVPVLWFAQLNAP